MPKSSRKKQTKTPDKNLALIAIILGATSFVMSVFTGIPAIIVGIIALRRNAGDRLQAKLGILFGVLSTLLWCFVIWLLGFHFFNSPLKQQYSVAREDYKSITTTINQLKTYEHNYGHYPVCQDNDQPQSCTDWQQFTDNNPGSIKYPIVFASNATAVPAEPEGTLVYATKAVCFFNTPTLPSYLRDHNDPTSGPSDDNVALVYYYAKGRACFSTNEKYHK
ncbi:MAG TPA: DUF4190 domain-containing protein [Candidatus Babeliales bacterium]|nr:DUF4190 domain-containing protein [Candidatus Babeliales bacterium]